MSNIFVVPGAQPSVAMWMVNMKGEVLLQLRGSSEPEYPGKWCLPGGRVRSQETARSVAVYRLGHELGIFHDVHVPEEPFRKDWVKDDEGRYASLSLFVTRHPMDMGDFIHRDHVMVPSVGFFDERSLIAMKEDGSLHPSTAYAVEQLVEGDNLMSYLKN